MSASATTTDFEFRIVPDTEYSLDAAASFGFGPNTGRPVPAALATMRLAFVADDLAHHAAVIVRQLPDGSLEVRGSGAEPALVERQLRRILSLDVAGAEWLAAGE